MTNNNEIGSITTTVKEREFVVERVVDAPRRAGVQGVYRG